MGRGMRRIKESVLIHAPREVVWQAFTDLTCWADWNSVLTRVRPGPEGALAASAGFCCALQPFGVAIPFAVRVELADPPARLLWSAERWGVRGRHWFHFSEENGATRLDSLEDLSGPTVGLAGPIFPIRRFTELTRQFLAELKTEAERRAASRPPE